ncbi:MAG: DHHA1 domain-containing protein [Candidatus Helarchaeales archaeon]
MEEYRALLPDIKKAAKFLLNEKKDGARFYCVAHLDADGIVSAGLLGKALNMEETKIDYKFAYSINEKVIKSLDENSFDILIFVDSGSSQLKAILHHYPDKKIVIVDHHKTIPVSISNSATEVIHVNPWLVGIDGTLSTCAGGLAYLIMKEMGNFSEYASQAIVAAIAEWQDAEGSLVGINSVILDEAEKNGYVKREKDIRLLGRETYTLLNMLFISFPVLPSLTTHLEECRKFIKELGLDENALWHDLTQEQKDQFVNKLKSRMEKIGLPPKVIESLHGDVFTLCKEEKGTMKRDAREYGFLVNATARRNAPRLGMSMIMGANNEKYKQALQLFLDDTNKLFEGIKEARENRRSISNNLEYIYSEKIEPKMVGTVCTMVLSSDLESCAKTLVCMASDNDGVKFSARCHMESARKAGINVGSALKKAAEKVGGYGGGHDNSGGGYIPKKRFNDFLSDLDAELQTQVARKKKK